MTGRANPLPGLTGLPGLDCLALPATPSPDLGGTPSIAASEAAARLAAVVFPSSVAVAVVEATPTAQAAAVSF